MKRKPDLRKYGLRCRNTWTAANNRVFAGESGRLSKRVIQGVDWSQLLLEADFGHGRTIVVGELVTSDDRPIADESKGVWAVGLVLGDDIDALKFTDIPE